MPQDAADWLVKSVGGAGGSHVAPAGRSGRRARTSISSASRRAIRFRSSPFADGRPRPRRSARAGNGRRRRRTNPSASAAASARPICAAPGDAADGGRPSFSAKMPASRPQQFRFSRRRRQPHLARNQSSPRRDARYIRGPRRIAFSGASRRMPRLSPSRAPARIHRRRGGGHRLCAAQDRHRRRSSTGRTGPPTGRRREVQWICTIRFAR